MFFTEHIIRESSYINNIILINCYFHSILIFYIVMITFLFLPKLFARSLDSKRDFSACNLINQISPLAIRIYN